MATLDDEIKTAEKKMRQTLAALAVVKRNG
jgi:hypothetical protein